MSIADKARAASMQFEAKKDALGQVQSGDWKLRFTVSPADVPPGLLTAAMGTRYQVVIVEIGDDEQPIEQKSESNHKLSQQAAMMCADHGFQNFLQSTRSIIWTNCTQPTSVPEIAAACVRRICKVQSRSEFDKTPEAANRWIDLRGEYAAWKMAQ